MIGIYRSITQALNWWAEPESLCGCQSILPKGDHSGLIISISPSTDLSCNPVCSHCKCCAFSYVFAHTHPGAPCLSVSSAARKNKGFDLKFPPCVLYHAPRCSFHSSSEEISYRATRAGKELGIPTASSLPQTANIHSLH